MQDMMGDFFAELASAETGPGGNGPGGELDLQEAPRLASRKQLTRVIKNTSRKSSFTFKKFSSVVKNYIH
jgi:hypothetical protein